MPIIAQDHCRDFEPIASAGLQHSLPNATEDSGHQITTVRKRFGPVEQRYLVDHAAPQEEIDPNEHRRSDRVLASQVTTMWTPTVEAGRIASPRERFVPANQAVSGNTGQPRTTHDWP